MKRCRTYLNMLLTGAILFTALVQPVYAQSEIQTADTGIDAAIDLSASDLPPADGGDGATGNDAANDMAMAAGVLPSNIFDANDVA